ncbi:unnamed protein product [Clonostachys byssicola]|uniref:Major facilitator superfamily (MFS) profile domain-containing protein n=1 Tax=Clonostachys byssicola TaxID=160290 RepID=A0A9N9UUK3_9HYPO|nr:unnamed protein product [Clonostachys byssicola]
MSLSANKPPTDLQSGPIKVENSRQTKDELRLPEESENGTTISTRNEEAKIHRHSDDESGLDVTYPEGGCIAWAVVAGSWLALFGSMSFMNSVGTFQAYLMHNQLKGLSSTAIGWIFGVYTGLTFLLGVQVGPIFDATGPRQLIGVGGLTTVLYLVLLGQCSEYWHFMLVFGVLGGFSLSLVFSPAISIVAHYFHKRRGLATGIASSGGAAGGIVFPLMLQRLFSTIGFVWAVRVAALVCAITFTTAVFLIRPRFPQKPLILSSVRPKFSVFRNGALAFTSLSVFFLEWGLFIPFSYLTSYALDHQQSSEFSYMLMSLINAGGIFGRWIPGFYADRFGRFNILILAILGCGVCNACFWLPAESSQSLMIFYALAFGFFSGSTVSLAPVCVGQLCKIEAYGRYYATAYVVVSASTFTATPIGGELLQITSGKYWALIIFTIASYAASFICLIMAKRIACGKKSIWTIF